MDVTIIMDGVIIIFGLYLIISTILMNKKQVVNKNLLAEEEMKKLKDTLGFIKYVSPVNYAFGGIIIVLSIVGLINEISFIPVNIPYYNYIELVIFLAVLYVYMNRYRNARELFIK